MTNSETQFVKSSDALSVVEEFLTAVHVEAELFLDFESRLLEAARLNPAIVPALSQFNLALEDPETRTTMDWLFARTDLRSAITALLENFGVQKGTVV